MHGPAVLHLPVRSQDFDSVFVHSPESDSAHLHHQYLLGRPAVALASVESPVAASTFAHSSEASVEHSYLRRYCSIHQQQRSLLHFELSVVGIA